MNFKKLFELKIMIEKDFINPEELPKWENAFSQVVVVDSGYYRTIYLSGQVSMDKDNQIIGLNNLSVQANQAFQNVKTALSSVGAVPEDVVKLNIYIKDYRFSDAECISEAFQKIFTHKKLPVSTWLGVQSLALDGLLIEIDAIAIVSSN
ncbi:RidA family protein [Emticicia agri]|uniref:RidA family protein n=1 Tax=Emticicia agri TaxID=2492393 RepID=A0A4Q5M178_9BACT|nr:RidA family protein [Emticicia agri]RYU95942.1 RidA family protein [Emticicia agri]